MRIAFVEIQNFRKLKSIRIELSSKKTLFVGANNSGKTTAMVALRRFLIDQKHFDTYDFTVSGWKKVNRIGQTWEENNLTPSDLAEWEDILPAMDVWLEVESNKLHYVQHLLPTLDWEGGLLGVRLRLEPRELELLHNDYIVARQRTIMMIDAAKNNRNSHDYKVPLWPTCLKDFIERDFNSKFGIRAYILDPTKLVDPSRGLAQPQTLSRSAEYTDDNPFTGLIRIDEINAQRGFSDIGNSSDMSYEGQGEGGTRGNKQKLSDQLRSYYYRHLDPSEMPEFNDLEALEAIYTAQTSFDEKLRKHFEKPFEEIEGLGYPGISDPTLTISTLIKPMEGLNHPSALQYDIIYNSEDTQDIPPKLPEQYNGLGYQNLISMVFRLMSFRDAWMQVGKSGKRVTSINNEIPPLHLVLIEEPEAHLHVQVQQVFIRKAYEILRNHEDLKNNTTLTTQLIVSTHSSHIAHECDFECLRYFRRKQALNFGEVPTSTVINLSNVFGLEEEDTAKFVTRYLRAAHCDLFFADAAIFIEGAAERIMIPHFIRERFPKLNQCYLTLLEVGGSHAHRFRSLIEDLGLTALIITDIDAARKTNKKIKSQPIEQKSGQVTRNMTLKSWIPKIKEIDKLLVLSNREKIKEYDDGFSVNVVYQSPIQISLDNCEVEIAANTFEDALVYENILLFKNLMGTGLIKKFRDALNQHKTSKDLSQAMFRALKSSNKAGFALELLFLKEPATFQIPTYIYKGLEWLQEQICRKEKGTVSVKLKKQEEVGVVE